MSKTINIIDLRSKFRTDSAENSIMQTITIAVSAILIAAGLVTAPGLINNARDNNAKTDLANIAYAEAFAVADRGAEFNFDSHPDAIAAYNELSAGNIKLTQSGGTRVLTLAHDGAFVSFARSESGKIFIRSSLNGLTREATEADLADEGVVFSRLAGAPAEFAGVEVPAVFTPGELQDAAQAVVDDEAYEFPVGAVASDGTAPGSGGSGTPVEDPQNAVTAANISAALLNTSATHVETYDAGSDGPGAPIAPFAVANPNEVVYYAHYLPSGDSYPSPYKVRLAVNGSGHLVATYFTPSQLMGNWQWAASSSYTTDLGAVDSVSFIYYDASNNVVNGSDLSVIDHVAVTATIGSSTGTGTISIVDGF